MSLIIAGERSGVGKTTVTLALLSSLSRRGLKVQSFKVGPDYIDPMFHKYVTGLPCRNLDAVLTSESYIQKCFHLHSQNCEYALVEGVMGLFDGVGNLSTLDTIDNMDFASTAHVARLLDIPVVLIVDCSRLSGSVAAIAHGYCSLDSRIKIAGLVLNRVGSDRHLSLLKKSLQKLQLPILGILRREDNISIPDRHLGLIPTGELPELDHVINRLADLGDSCFDWEKLLPIIQSHHHPITPSPHHPISPSSVKIAVAWDQAFNFYYQDNLDLLAKLGAELIFWSPLQDQELPKNIQGLYFGGGFPEMFAQDLSANYSVIQAVKSAILSGIPTIAECGGLMYLCENIIDFENNTWPMVGILPTSAQMDKRLTLGYRRVEVLENTFLLTAGTNIYGHEFHRSHVITNSQHPLFNTFRYDCEENTGLEGWNLPNVHASYVHQHWGESEEIPQMFIEQCQKF
ncbi:MAG: cobyrinate a,c-diamide synthase [Sphaerospermopsis sp. SIO1G1]|nr:cobyrinate a,c-diamide synthase [Sphaerospermopsis sp. SIO1G1]